MLRFVNPIKQLFAHFLITNATLDKQRQTTKQKEQ